MSEQDSPQDKLHDARGDRFRAEMGAQPIGGGSIAAAGGAAPGGGRGTARRLAEDAAPVAGEHDERQAAFRYGWQARLQHAGHTFDEVEPELRRAWDKINPNMDWSSARPAVRDAWERAVPAPSDEPSRLAAPRDESEFVIDPICGMQVRRDPATPCSDFGGRTYYFCSEACKRKFDADMEPLPSPSMPID